LYTGAESGWTRSSGIVFTDASRYECRYSDSRGLNPGARKTHLPHTHSPQTISTQCWLVFGGGFFFSFPTFVFSLFFFVQSHKHTRIHTFLDGMDGSTCLVRISEQRSITFNRNKKGERLRRSLEQQTYNATHHPALTLLNRIFSSCSKPPRSKVRGRTAGSFSIQLEDSHSRNSPPHLLCAPAKQDEARL
jgi:hypothetical protein